MKIIVVANLKGGVGKTTVCTHLAVEASRTGRRAALLDTDPQGSMAGWWNAREAEQPAFIRSSPNELPGRLDTLHSAGFDYLFIDTPPLLADTVRKAAEVADLVLIPVRTSPHDLRAIGGTVDLIEPFDKPMVFVLNGAIRRTRIIGEAALVLSQHGTVAPTVMHIRVDFMTSQTDGRTVQELDPSSPSAAEVTDLWTYVLTRLSRKR
jgi:chromosome partitioning protein